MKLLLFVCLLGLAAADIMQHAAPAIDQSVLAFLEGAVQAGSLSEALGVSDPEIEQMADDVEAEVGRKVKETLEEMFKKIKESVDQGKNVARELLQKIKEMRNKIGENGGEKGKELWKEIREKAKQALKNLLEKLGKRNLDDAMDQTARMKFKELVDNIKAKLSSGETIQKLREYLKNHVGKSEMVQNLKELVARLRDADIRQLIHHLLDYQTGQTQKSVAFRGETWEKVKNFFKDINVKIQEHSKKFGEWVKDMWGKGLDKLKEKHGALKAIAMEFISHSKDMSSEMAREALEFFRPYKDDLGALWKQIVDCTKEIIGNF